MTNPLEEKKSKSGSAKKPAKLADSTLRERDIEILKLVYEHRFLDTELISKLLEVGTTQSADRKLGKDGKERPTQYGFGMQALYKRLKMLSDAKYLDPRPMLDQPIGRGTGVPRIAFGLGRSSIRIMAQVTGRHPAGIREIVEANKVKSQFLRHTLELATFRVVLELACRKSEGNVTLQYWNQGHILRDFVDGPDEKEEEVRFSVYPDAFFILSVAGLGKAHYFLEIDRGTMPINAIGNRPDISKKFYGYLAYARTKKFQEKYFYFHLPDGSLSAINVADSRAKRSSRDGASEEPMRGFRVLFVTQGAIKSDLTTSGRVGNMLSYISRQGPSLATKSLYWFVSDDSISLETPESIFKKMWITPNRNLGLQSLIE